MKIIPEEDKVEHALFNLNYHSVSTVFNRNKSLWQYDRLVDRKSLFPLFLLKIIFSEQLNA